jgi:hypothetical protein
MGGLDLAFHASLFRISPCFANFLMDLNLGSLEICLKLNNNDKILNFFYLTTNGHQIETMYLFA